MRSILIQIDVMPPAALLPVSLRRRLFGASALAAVGAFTMPLARAGDGWQPAVLPQGVQRDIDSAITGQRYRIYLHIPATPAPVGGHSVLYALDGNATFPALALMARSTASRSARTGQVAPVIVGIGYPSGQDFGGGRARDYTPRITASGKAQPAGEGGADCFLGFIERELKPLIAGLAPLDPARQALFGHSYGGLCTLHALFTRPGMFQTYLASSPSIWYGERVVLSDMAGLAKRTAALPSKPTLMLSAGELNSSGRADRRPRDTRPSPPNGAWWAKRRTWPTGWPARTACHASSSTCWPGKTMAARCSRPWRAAWNSSSTSVRGFASYLLINNGIG